MNPSDFPNITNIFGREELPYKLFQSSHEIHANHLDLIGNDKKPFDISFDSYERYFSKYNIDLKGSTPLYIHSVPVKLVSIKDLTKIYEIGSNGSNTSKIQEYKNKLQNLSK